MALRYGTLPIVRETGGLKDTVEAYNEYEGTGTGFSFTNYNAHEMLDAIRKALDCYKSEETMQALIGNAMKADFGFEQSAIEYARHYIWML